MSYTSFQLPSALTSLSNDTTQMLVERESKSELLCVYAVQQRNMHGRNGPRVSAEGSVVIAMWRPRPQIP